MALDQQTNWEIRTTGNDNNGGGYIANGGGIDYSMQSGSQLSLSDASQVLASNTLTIITGVFTTQMSGNTIFFRSGTNFVTGFYQILKWVDSTNVVIDRTCTTGGAGSLGTGEVGGARLSLDNNSFPTTVVGGNTAYIQVGTYNLAQPFSSANQVGTLPMYWLGYNLSRNDNPTSTGRPFINVGTSSFAFGNSNMSNYIQFSSSSGLGIINGTSNRHQFNKFISLSITSTNLAARGNSTRYFSCEFTAPNCIGFGDNNISGTLLEGCSFYNCGTGSLLQAQSVQVSDCVYSGNKLGSTVIGAFVSFLRTTFYGGETPSGIGISMSGVDASSVFDCIFYGFNSALVNTAFRKTQLVGYNNFFNNNTDRVKFEVGIGDVALNPNFIAANSGNFSLGTNLKNIGFPGTINTGSGSITTGFADIGAIQANTSSGTGSANVTNIFIIDD